LATGVDVVGNLPPDASVIRRRMVGVVRLELHAVWHRVRRPQNALVSIMERTTPTTTALSAGIWRLCSVTNHSTGRRSNPANAQARISTPGWRAWISSNRLRASHRSGDYSGTRWAEMSLRRVMGRTNPATTPRSTPSNENGQTPSEPARSTLRDTQRPPQPIPESIAVGVATSGETKVPRRVSPKFEDGPSAHALRRCRASPDIMEPASPAAMENVVKCRSRRG
jgi:hypothetical protein